LLEAGVRRAIIGAVDPNSKVNGRGAEALRRAGVDVVIASVPAEYAKQNEAYVKYITTGKPFVLLKAAVSMNGKISAAAGVRTKLTGDAVRAEVHAWRNEYQLIAIGAETALIDDPLLTCRSDAAEIRQPIRLVIDSRGRLPLTGRLVRTAFDAPLWLAAVEGIDAGKRRELENAGVEVLICAADERGRVDLRDLLRKLGEREIAAMMVEGGARLNEAFLAGGLADKLVMFMAPCILGGADAVPLTAGETDFSRRFEISSGRLVGDDLRIEAYPSEEEACSQES
jgi:diaminohydroxyphosphoribosylaminopyrimidine deaminase/5-amino-6-(5-phosphoribosylamino)uracil reductase